MKKFLSTVGLLFLGANQAVAFPDLQTQLQRIQPEEDLSAAYDFEGILALNNCSGSLVRFDDSQDDDQAIVLTNGHCVDLLEPGIVRSQEASTRNFDVLDSSAKRIGSIRADQLIYATMTKTDVALYRLKDSYRSIFTKFTIRPLTLSRESPELGTDIEVISGYWKRGYSCKVEFVSPSLKEGKWTFQDSIRYSRPGCEIIGGTSGSPVLASGTRTVVAINNTANDNGGRCQLNNPCEVDSDGTIVYKKGYGYAQQTSWIYTCHNSGGTIDLKAEGCVLPKPTN